MTLADLGNVGELVGAVAVVVSLVYLSVQIRQNTRMMRVSTHHATKTAYNTLHLAFGSDPIVSGLLDRGAENYSQLDREERFRYAMLMRASFGLHGDIDGLAFQAPEIIQLELLFSGGMLPGTSIPIVARGNGDGFTLSDGTVIPAISPEDNTTYEIGYKGQLGRRLYVDVNLYRSSYESFQSPLTPITDPAKGMLRDIVDRDGLSAFEVPPGVGGRYSVFTSVWNGPAVLNSVKPPPTVVNSVRNRLKSFSASIEVTRAAWRMKRPPTSAGGTRRPAALCAAGTGCACPRPPRTA